MSNTDQVTDADKATQREFLMEFDRNWLAHRVRDMRDIMELRQEEVAKYLGIKRSSLGHMESVADYARVSPTAQTMADLARLAGVPSQVVLDKRISIEELKSIVYDANDRHTGEQRDPPFLQIIADRKKRRELEKAQRKAQREPDRDENAKAITIGQLQKDWKASNTLMPFKSWYDDFIKAHPDFEIKLPAGELASLIAKDFKVRPGGGPLSAAGNQPAVDIQGAKEALDVANKKELGPDELAPPVRPWYPGAPENLKAWVNEKKTYFLRPPGWVHDPQERSPQSYSRRFWDAVQFEVEMLEEKAHQLFNKRIGPSPVEIEVDVRSQRWVMALDWTAPHGDEVNLNGEALRHAIMKLTMADRLSKQNFSKAIILYDMTKLRNSRPSIFFGEDDGSDEYSYRINQELFDIDECLAHDRALGRALNINVFTVTEPKEAANLILKLLKNQLTKEQIQDMTGGVLLPSELEDSPPENQDPQVESAAT